MGNPSPHTTPHGQKRQPDDELDHDQRLSKRFNLLNLEQTGKLYIPVKSESEASAKPSPPRRRRSNAVTDSMPVDDTKDRVYIHNLDEEIADIESEEEKLIFLPDIERHFMRIPSSVLTGQTSPKSSTQMILYNAPSNMAMPEEQAAVRRAIAETRARAQRQEQSESRRETGDREHRSRLHANGRHYDDDDIDDYENAMEME